MVVVVAAAAAFERDGQTRFLSFSSDLCLYGLDLLRRWLLALLLHLLHPCVMNSLLSLDELRHRHSSLLGLGGNLCLYLLYLFGRRLLSWLQLDSGGLEGLGSGRDGLCHGDGV